ncbi:MAG TPA: type III-A CRISPR-associated RAMP protein Csm4 [Thermoanaerobacterales bacterium]|uniref:type III-A CRISPR-associated RAMP protein Csm4 n=1 Tax=Tepidanaerobacter sp. GT38 TaxID=2722793 RepID=UPI0018410E66|nr:type III-A CRISPR-associated RAMP protein Csm4 [Tepidanaerobacter sp. GT38]MCG1013080.1 type III-A CRISPR-associated RAMP protein Csm4 [Tepidanaerobacter sp. GT38]HHY41824.1 type III-A CRISPR-associated RAMP protein Csm4 [Thermoanaerobacterales bacterium]
MKVFKFYPKNHSKFHFGSGHGKLEETFSSDKLFSALYNCAVMLYGQDKEENHLLNLLQNSLISSLYPGIRSRNLENQKEVELFFLPRPLLPQAYEENKDLKKHKKEKKIRYISIGAFEHLNNSWQDSGKCEFTLSDLKTFGGVFACTAEEFQSLGIAEGAENIKLLDFDAKPRVVISRFDDHSENFFFQEEGEVTYYQKNEILLEPFMYFLFDGQIDSRLIAAIRFMADEGLGGKRSQGMGYFEEVLEGELPNELFSGKGQYYMNLSAVYPSIEEVDDLKYYELVERSGYIYSKYGRPLRKKRIRLLKEGSIFSRKIDGRIIDISPEVFKEHSVLLNGRAFLIPLGRCSNES